jgi:hypothetical protein
MEWVVRGFWLCSAALTLSCDRTTSPDGAWDITTTTIESSCPETRPVNRSTRETFVISSSGGTIRLTQDKYDYAGPLHGDQARITGPTKPGAGFQTEISVEFDGWSEFEGQATVSNSNCIVKEKVTGSRTSTKAPSDKRASGSRKPPRPLPELPKNLKAHVDATEFVGNWQVLETVDGSPCKDGQYARGATIKVALTGEKKLTVTSMKPAGGWGNAIYGPVPAAVVGSSLEWEGSFPSGNDTFTSTYSIGLTEEGSVAGTGRWMYSYKDQPERACSGPSVVMGARGQ